MLSNNNKIPEDVLPIIENELRALVNSIIKGTTGDAVNLINILSALAESTDAIRHPFIKKNATQILSFPESYNAPSLWDILLRFDSASVCGLEELYDADRRVLNFFKQFSSLDSNDYKTHSGDGWLPVQILMLAIEKEGRSIINSFSCDPRILFFYAHYIQMLSSRCSVKISPEMYRSLINECIQSAHFSLYDANEINSYKVYDRFGIALLVFSYAKAYDTVKRIVEFLLEYFKENQPSFVHACFLLMDLNEALKLLKSDEKIVGPLEQLIVCLMNVLIDSLKTPSQEIFVNMRTRSIRLLGICSLLTTDQKRQMETVLEGAESTDIIIQIRRILINSLVLPENRKWISDLMSKFNDSNSDTKYESLHKWLKENINIIYEVIDKVKTPQELISSKTGDCDCFACIIATCVLESDTTGNLCILKPEFANGSGHVYIEICQQDPNGMPKMIPIDPMAEYGCLIEEVKQKEDCVIKIQLKSLVEWSINQLCDYIECQTQNIYQSR